VRLFCNIRTTDQKVSTKYFCEEILCRSPQNLSSQVGLQNAPDDVVPIWHTCRPNAGTLLTKNAMQAPQLPAEQCWLHQVHGCTIVTASPAQQNCEADGSLSRESGAVCAVMTADC
jgi:copper oxidase (laccase) domain-containing protein